MSFQQDVSYINWKHIESNVVLISSESNGHEALSTGQDFCVSHPPNLTRAWVCFKLMLQLVDFLFLVRLHSG